MRLSSTAVLALVLALTACTASQPAESGPPVATAPAPSSSPSVAPEVQVERVVLRADGIDVVAENGATIDTVDLLEDRDGVVEVLRAAFSAEPDISRYKAGIETQAGTRYDWGGFEVRVGDAPLNAFEPDITVEWTAAEVEGVTVETAGGATIGTPRLELDYDVDMSIGGSDFLHYIEAVPVGTFGETGFVGNTGNPNEELIWSIVAIGDLDGVDMFSLPAKNYGV